MELLNQQTISEVLTREAPWSGSHGATERYLGMGLVYYSLVYIHRAKTVVCLGSGGGFVPRMMRQAQRDLDIANSSQTILVDANKPESGWGAPAWLSPDSFFRRAFPDIELLNVTTKEAAENYFAPRAIVIDYLHIDADHSFAACLQDFELYRPFLAEESMLTLHDTNFAGAGVKHVVDYVRTRGDCEVLDFPRVGAGTALIRILAGPASASVPGGVRRRYGSDGAAVIVIRKAGTPISAPPEIGWKYLESEAFATRSVIAASFLRQCKTVVEIGGGKTAIDQFLYSDHHSVIVVDPFIRETQRTLQLREPCQVWHVRARFQDLEWRIIQPREYGVVMLGFELQGMVDNDYQTLFQLINNSQITVIEFPSSWGPSCEQFRFVCSNTSMREVFVCKLDLQGNDVGSLENSWPPRFDREIHVLEPTRT